MYTYIHACIHKYTDIYMRAHGMFVSLSLLWEVCWLHMYAYILFVYMYIHIYMHTWLNAHKEWHVACSQYSRVNTCLGTYICAHKDHSQAWIQRCTHAYVCFMYICTLNVRKCIPIHTNILGCCHEKICMYECIYVYTHAYAGRIWILHINMCSHTSIHARCT